MPAEVIALNRYRLWDFRNARLDNEILEWARSGLTTRDRAALNNKFRRLEQIEFEMLIHTKLLCGPIYKHVYKLVIKGDVMLRPMLCRGPHDVHHEYTILLGAIEVGGKLPKGSQQQAEANRQIVLDDPGRRCKHERIP